MKFAATILVAAQALTAQPPFQTQTPSSIAVSVKDDATTVSISNVEFEATGTNVPGLPTNQRLVIRKTVKSKEVLGDIGMEGSVLVEAWRLEAGMKGKPLYALKESGAGVRTVKGELIEISRGLEEVEWWSVYTLGTAAHLFDTYVPTVIFTSTREVQTLRYLGLEVPPDDIKDARLKSPNVVAVLSYAAADHVIREALITCSDPKKAALLRSYPDSLRTITLEGQVNSWTPPTALKLTISQTDPSEKETLTIRIPFGKDDLDLRRAEVPAGLSIAAWKR